MGDGWVDVFISVGMREGIRQGSVTTPTYTINLEGMERVLKEEGWSAVDYCKKYI